MAAMRAPSSPPLRVIRGRRGVPDMVTVRATHLADLHDELVSAGEEMIALGRRLEFAITAERTDLALHIAGRLQTLGQGYAAEGRDRPDQDA